MFEKWKSKKGVATFLLIVAVVGVAAYVIAERKDASEPRAEFQRVSFAELDRAGCSGLTVLGEGMIAVLVSGGEANKTMCWNGKQVEGVADSVSEARQCLILTRNGDFCQMIPFPPEFGIRALSRCGDQGYYATGVQRDTTESKMYDFFLAKDDLTGRIVWSIRGYGESKWDFGTGLTEMPDGSCIATGQFKKQLEFRDTAGSISLIETDCGEGDPNLDFPGASAFVVSATTNGEVSWAVSVRGPGSSTGDAVAKFSDGSCAVTGIFTSRIVLGADTEYETVLYSEEGTSLFLARYGKNGEVLWARQSEGDGSNIFHVQVGTDAEDSVYVSGGSTGNICFEKDSGGRVCANASLLSLNDFREKFFLAKFDLNGRLQWLREILMTRLIPFSLDGPDCYFDACVFPDGRVAVVGDFRRSIRITGQKNYARLAAPHNAAGAFLCVYAPDGELSHAEVLSAGTRAYADIAYDLGEGLVMAGALNQKSMTFFPRRDKKHQVSWGYNPNRKGFFLADFDIPSHEGE